MASVMVIEIEEIGPRLWSVDQVIRTEGKPPLYLDYKTVSGDEAMARRAAKNLGKKVGADIIEKVE